MKQRPLILTVIVMLGLTLVPSVQAKDDGWSMSKLNPFHKKEEARVTPKRGDDKPRTKLNPFAKHDGPVRNVSHNKEGFWSKTKHTLMPWTAPEKKRPASATGLRKQASHDDNSKSNFSLFSQKEEPKRIETVGDFLAQPRPDY